MTLIVLITLALILVLGLWRSTIKSRRLSLLTWNELAGKLQPVHRDGIRRLALEHLEPAVADAGRRPDEIWEMVGGIDGLTRMRENADVLIALASYAQRWSNDESVLVAERMRRDGLALRRAVVGLGIGVTCGYGGARASAYVHEAATSYWLMRERLLALYKISHGGIHPILEDAL